MNKKKLVPDPLAPMPEQMPSDATPVQRAKANSDWLGARVRYAQERGEDARGIAVLAGQYTQALKYHARLSGAFDVTQATIMRSGPWAEIMRVIRDTLKDHPALLEKVALALNASESSTPEA